jgi:aryl-alcohol dehydrogenase-like predicted oxidoreductase
VNREKVRALRAVADDLHCTRAQLALAWCLTNSRVSTVITGASRREQVQENMGALAVVRRLTPDVMARLEGILGNKPLAEERPER